MECEVCHLDLNVPAARPGNDPVTSAWRDQALSLHFDQSPACRREVEKKAALAKKQAKASKKRSSKRFKNPINQ